MAGLSQEMARNSKQTSSQLTELTVGKKTFVRQGGKKSWGGSLAVRAIQTILSGRGGGHTRL